MIIANWENFTAIIGPALEDLPKISSEPGNRIHQSDWYKGFVTLSDYFEDAELRQEIEEAFTKALIPYELVQYIAFNHKAYRIFVPLENLQEARDLSMFLEFGKLPASLPSCYLPSRTLWHGEFISPTA